MSKYVTVQHVQKKLEFDLDYEEKEEEKTGKDDEKEVGSGGWKRRKRW